MHSEEDSRPIVLPQHLTCDNEHHYGVLVQFSGFWGFARHTNLENFLPRPCPIDPSTDPMQFWPSWAPSSTIFGMCWVILNYIFAHFGRTTRPRWPSWAFLGWSSAPSSLILGACYGQRRFFWPKIAFWAKNNISGSKNCVFFAIPCFPKGKADIWAPLCSSPYRIVTNLYTSNTEFYQLFSTPLFYMAEP